MVNEQANIPAVNVERAAIDRIDVDQLKIGTTSIQEIALTNIDVNADVGSTSANDVSMSLDLDFSITIGVSIDLWLVDFEESYTFQLPSIHIPTVPVGELSISMDKVGILIEDIRVNNLALGVNPISSINATGAKANKIDLTDTKVPSNPFSLDGIEMEGLSLQELDVPAVHANLLDIGGVNELHINIPQITLPQISLAAASGKITSTHELKADAKISQKEVGMDFAIFSIALRVTPTAHINIGSLIISDAKIAGKVDATTIRNVTVPLDLFDIKMGELNIYNINVPSVDLHKV
jgi:hypothetical protein